MKRRDFLRKAATLPLAGTAAMAKEPEGETVEVQAHVERSCFGTPVGFIEACESTEEYDRFTSATYRIWGEEAHGRKVTIKVHKDGYDVRFAQ